MLNILPALLHRVPSEKFNRVKNVVLFLGHGYLFFAYAPGPDLASNAEAVLQGRINSIDIAIFAEEVAPGQALPITYD